MFNVSNWIKLPNNNNNINKIKENIFLKEISNFALDLKVNISRENEIVLNKLEDIEKQIYNLNKHLKRDHIIKFRHELNKLINEEAYNQDIEDFFKCCIISSESNTKKFPSYLCKSASKYFPNKNTLSNNLKNIYHQLYPGLSNITNDFRNFDLSNVELNYIDLSNANFTKANLTNANLSSTKLMNTNFNKAKLSRAKFMFANLNNANLSNTLLTYANFTEAILNNVNLTNSDLSNAKFMFADLSKANLTNTFGNKTVFTNSQFIETDFTKAKFTKVNLNYIHFKNTNFTNAQFINTNLRGTKLDSAKCESSIFKLDFSSNLDLDFNHINNIQSGSILTAINSIDNKYVDIKNNLMIQVFEHLKSKNISSIMDALKDIIFNRQFDYTEAFKAVLSFRDRFFAENYNIGNTRALKLSESDVEFQMNYINSLENNKFKEFTLKNNGFFIQLIHWARKYSKNKALVGNNNKNLEYNLYCKYLLQHGIIKKVGTNYEILNNNIVYDINDFLTDNLIFIYSYKTNHINNLEFIIVYSRYIDKYLYLEEIDESKDAGGKISWNMVYHIKNNKTTIDEEKNLSQIFDNFKVFKDSYEFTIKKIKFIKLIDILNLDNKNIEYNYKVHFIKALESRFYQIDYTDAKSQKDLSKIFNVFFNEIFDYNGNKIFHTELALKYAKDKLNLKDEHIQQILTTYEVQNKNKKEKASLLLILSGLFAKYSSSNFFGNEHNSPIALRYYAYGLMKEAHKLYPNIIPKEFKKKDNNDWVNRFLGIGNAFTCTEGLSNVILKECENLACYNDLLHGVIPPAWS